MKLNQITQLLFALFLVISLNSCNDKTENTYYDESADAQVYSFALKGTPVTKEDTVNYPVLRTTKFAIDQYRKLIYNPDSLPYQTRLSKFAVSISFAPSTVPGKLELIYPKDSIVDWNGSDSVDFNTEYSFPKLRVTPMNGKEHDRWVYDIELRIHKIDTDTILWKKMTAQPSAVGKQKTILKDGIFHTFSIDKSGGLSLYKANRANDIVWLSGEPLSGLSPSTINLESITFFKDRFFAVDNARRAYTSTDGINWILRKTNVHSILGVLPDKVVDKDVLLVVVEDAGKYYYAKTVDMQTLTIVDRISTSPASNIVSPDFPSHGFYSVTNYDRDNQNNNILAIVGGRDFAGLLATVTWSIRLDGNMLEVMPSRSSYLFEAKSGMAAFVYDGYLYALTQNQFYKTESWGYKWVEASSKECLDPNMPNASGQTVIVDKDNYIWVFGGISDSGSAPVQQVWRGRLNKLNPKQ